MEVLHPLKGLLTTAQYARDGLVTDLLNFQAMLESQRMNQTSEDEDTTEVKRQQDIMLSFCNRLTEILKLNGQSFQTNLAIENEHLRSRLAEKTKYIHKMTQKVTAQRAQAAHELAAVKARLAVEKQRFGVQSELSAGLETRLSELTAEITLQAAQRKKETEVRKAEAAAVAAAHNAAMAAAQAQIANSTTCARCKRQIRMAGEDPSHEVRRAEHAAAAAAKEATAACLAAELAADACFVSKPQSRDGSSSSRHGTPRQPSSPPRSARSHPRAKRAQVSSASAVAASTPRAQLASSTLPGSVSPSSRIAESQFLTRMQWLPEDTQEAWLEELHDLHVMLAQVPADMGLEVCLREVESRAVRLTSSLGAILFLTEVQSNWFWRCKTDSSQRLRYPLSKGIAGFVARTGQSVCVDVGYEHPCFAADIDSPADTVIDGAGPLLLWPIRNRTGELFGVLLVGRRPDHSFRPLHEKLIRVLSAHAGSLLTHALLHERLGRTKLQYSSLEQLAGMALSNRVVPSSDWSMDRWLQLRKVSRLAATLLQADDCVVLVYDRESKSLKGLAGDSFLDEVTFPSTQGILAPVVQSGEPINIPDAQSHAAWEPSVDAALFKELKHVQSLMARPVVDPLGDMMGVAVAVNRRAAVGFPVETFGSNEEQLMALVCTSAASTLTAVGFKGRVWQSLPGALDEGKRWSRGSSRSRSQPESSQERVPGSTRPDDSSNFPPAPQGFDVDEWMFADGSDLAEDPKPVAGEDIPAELGPELPSINESSELPLSPSVDTHSVASTWLLDPPRDSEELEEADVAALAIASPALSGGGDSAQPDDSADEVTSSASDRLPCITAERPTTDSGGDDRPNTSGRPVTADRPSTADKPGSGGARPGTADRPKSSDADSGGGGGGGGGGVAQAEDAEGKSEGGHRHKGVAEAPKFYGVSRGLDELGPASDLTIAEDESEGL